MRKLIIVAVAAVAVVIFMSAPVLALQCDIDIAEIDAALISNLQAISPDILTQAQVYRDEGATLCAEGQDAEAIDVLAIAKFMVGLYAQ